MTDSHQPSVGERAVIFLHIPKAAGTTLHRIIEQQYPAAAVHSFGPQAHRSVEQFKQFSEEQRRELKVVKGHMAFGLHTYLPQPSTYITLLRDPAERIISYYYFVRRTPAHHLHERVTGENLMLEAVLDGQLSADLDNGQTRLLSGVWNDVGYGELTAEMLDTAKQNLRDYFSVVGLVEHFDETLLLLRRIFGWKLSLFTKVNAAESRPRRESLSAGDLKAIETHNQFDLELYEYAAELFRQRVKACGLRFALETRYFHFYKWGYSIYDRQRARWRQGLSRLSRI